MADAAACASAWNDAFDAVPTFAHAAASEAGKNTESIYITEGGVDVGVTCYFRDYVTLDC